MQVIFIGKDRECDLSEGLLEFEEIIIWWYRHKIELLYVLVSMLGEEC